MKKIAFVVQRYGLEVNGGAELQCRQFAEHMLQKYPEIHVITTKAIDYITWKNEYEADEEEINGVTVHRFPVEYERDLQTFTKINKRFLLGLLPADKEQEWIDKQGPYVPKLIEYIREHKSEYDVFVFFTYLYYPTVMGIKEVYEKAIVVPEAHDEPCLKMQIFDDVFKLPRAFFFNTEEERQLVHHRYHNENIKSLLGGAGVDVPDVINAERFKKKYHLQDFMIYVGRIEETKNCKQLFNYFLKYKRRNHNDMKLVLMGKPVMNIPEHEDIISLGFVDDVDKFDGIAAAQILVLPSEFESLSLVVLEAMRVGTSVIVNGKCPVLKGHCVKSKGAFYYNNYCDFEEKVNYLLEHEDEAEVMCENAKKYVDENYQWDGIVERLSELIEAI